MPLVITNGVQVRLLWTRGGSGYAINVLGGTGPAPVAVTQSLANTLGTAIKSAMVSSAVQAQISNTINLDKVGLRSIGVPNQPEYLDSGGPTPGGAVADFLPPQTAFLVTLRTALAGKEYRGRVYLCGFTEASNDATGVALATCQTACVAFIDAIKAAMTTNGITMSVLSRKLNQGTAVTLTQSRNLVWETQRRRALPGI